MNRFKTYLEKETGQTMMKCRKPYQIVEGKLVGSEISRWGPGVWKVWTNRVKLARRVSNQYALSFRLLYGECELYVPDGLAVQLLPQFGAWRSPRLTQEHRDRLRTNALMARSFVKNTNHKALPATQQPQNGVGGL